MNILADLQSINYIAVAVATIAIYVLGFGWYHWSLFGQAWADALGLTKEQAENTEGLGGAFVASLVSGLLKAVLVAVLMTALDLTGFLNGVMFGAVMAVAFTVTSLGYYNGFARLSPKFTRINATHSVVELALAGAIIGAFG